MTYEVGNVVEVNTIDIIEGKGYQHMVIIRDDRVPVDAWWAFFFTLTKEDFERHQQREKIRLKVISVETGERVVFAEAPRSPPYLRFFPGRIHALHPMGFESQNWGRYSWLE